MAEIKEHVFFLTHRLRRPLANLVGICRALRDDSKKDESKQSVSILLNKSLIEFDEVIKEYDKMFNIK